MAQAQTISVLLIEDDPETQANICDIAVQNGMTIASATNGDEGLRLAASGAHDVIILDRMLPGLSGMDVIERLRAADIGAPVLMLSALGRAEHRIEGLESGVDDYLAKPFEPAELVARIRALRRRAANQATSAVILFGDMECHVKARTAHRGGRHVPLSPKEFALFRYLMEHAGEVVTREMLLRHVWKLSFDPQTTVVDVNVGRLRRKLEADPADPAIIKTVRNGGYLFAPAVEPT